MAKRKKAIPQRGADSQHPPAAPGESMASKKAKNPYVVVRTFSAGVHVGELVSRDGQEVVLANARRVWRWYGANTLHEVALHGVAKESKVSEPVAGITLTQAIEIITAASEGEASLRGAAWAK